MKSAYKISIMENLLKSGLIIGAIVLSTNSFGQKQDKNADLPVCPVKREVTNEGQLTRIQAPAKKSTTVMKMAKMQTVMPERKKAK